MKPLRVFVVHLTMLPYVLGTVLKSASITVSRFYVLARHWLVILVFWSIHTKSYCGIYYSTRWLEWQQSKAVHKSSLRRN